MGDIDRADDADATAPLEAVPYRGLDDDEDHAAVRQHYEAFFDREGEELTWPHGVGAHRMGAFRVLEVPPNERTPLFTYASVGAFALREPCIELVLLTGERSARAVELVATAAAYHQATGLSVGDRMPLGRPWLAGSTCDAFLVSPPHPLGATFERARGGTRPVRVLWLMPITPAERRFAAENGVAELELRFEDAPVEHWVAGRPSVV
jgi:hypothetical protein